MNTLRTSFRSKLMLLTIVPLAVAQIVTLFAVMRTVETDVDLRARESLVIGGEVVSEFLKSRGEQLRTSVDVLSSDFGLKEATATGDAETIRSVLKNHSGRVNADMAMLLDLDGTTIASTISSDGLSTLPLESIETTIVLNGVAYHVFVAPLRAPVPIAWIVFGFRIDSQLADRISSLTGLQVAVVSSADSNGTVLASTSAHVQVGVEAASMFADLRYLTLRVPFADGGSNVAIVLQRSLDEAMMPYVEARKGLLFFGVALLMLVAIAGVLFSTTISKPLRTLAAATQQMISGNYDGDVDVDVKSKDEFGELASGFNEMRRAISEREQRISHLALHDDLTGLPNRHKIVRQLTAAIESGRGDGRSVSILSIRITRMGEISSTLGHKATDELIVNAAQQLRRNLDDGDLLGQTGPNEFILVLPGCDTDTALARVDRVEQILGAGVTLDNTVISLQTRIGIAEFPRHSSQPAELMRFASIARSDAEACNDRARVYEDGREEEFVHRLRVVNDLQTAIRHREVLVCYQPKANLQEGHICGVEALVRWDHPELGFLSPDSFIPAAEQAGVIVHLTRYVLSEAVQQCRRWQDFGFDISVSVNISARDLTDEYLPYHVLQILKDNDVKPEALTLEVTESSIMEDLGQSILVLECLRDIGVRISIDDFGTGHSSLAQLKNIPAHELKIDKAFVTNICTDADNEAIVRATVELAHRLKLQVVAEGIEDDATMRRISSLGIDHAQGYFLSKPVAPDELTEWLQTYTPTVYHERRKAERAFTA